MKEKTTAITGSIALSGGAYISAVVMFAVSILFARFLDKDTFGLYTFVISLAAMLYLFTDFGLDWLSYYFIARYKDTRMDIVKSVIYLSVKVKLILTSLMCFILIAIGFIDYRYWYVAVFFIIFVLNQFIRSFLEAFQYFRLSGQLQIIESIFKIILIYVVLNYITTTQLSIILIATMLPMFISSILAARNILAALPKKPFVNLYDLKHEAYHYGKWFVIGSILLPIISNVIQVVLGMLNELAALAIFGIGKTLSNMVLILGSSFKSALISSFLKKSDRLSIGYALTDSIRYLLIISVFIAFSIHFISSPLITLFYTAKYAESAIIFEILSYGILFSTVFVGLSPAAGAFGRPDMNVKVYVINAVVLLSFATLLIPKYGALGAAIALTIGLIVSTMVFALVAHKLLQYSFPRKTLINCIIASSFAIIPLQIIEFAPVYRIIVDVSIGSIVYLLILYAIREIKQEDIALMQESIKEIMKYLKEQSVFYKK